MVRTDRRESPSCAGPRQVMELVLLVSCLDTSPIFNPIHLVFDEPSVGINRQPRDVVHREASGDPSSQVLLLRRPARSPKFLHRVCPPLKHARGLQHSTGAHDLARCFRAPHESPRVTHYHAALHSTARHPTLSPRTIACWCVARHAAVCQYLLIHAGACSRVSAHVRASLGMRAMCRAACTERHAPSDVPNGVPHVVPSGALSGAPSGVLFCAPDAMPYGVLSGMSSSALSGTPTVMPNTAPHVMPADAPSGKR